MLTLKELTQKYSLPDKELFSQVSKVCNKTLKKRLLHTLYREGLLSFKTKKKSLQHWLQLCNMLLWSTFDKLCCILLTIKESSQLNLHYKL